MVGVLWMYQILGSNKTSSNYAYAHDMVEVNRIVDNIRTIYEPIAANHSVMFRTFNMDNAMERQRFDKNVKQLKASQIPV